MYIKLPNGITAIKSCTFTLCKKLSSIIIPESVNSIYHFAFEDSGLTSIYIPKSVSRIYCAFGCCSKLEAIKVAVENQAYMSEKGVLFSHDGTILYAYPGGKKGRYSIPYGVTEICGFAFHGCSELSYVSIPYSVSVIGARAFKCCSELSSIIIPPKVDSMFYDTFSNCDNLSLVIYLGEKCTLDYSEYRNFDVCPKLNEVHVLPTYSSDSFCNEMPVRKCINIDSCGASTKYIFDNYTGNLFIYGQGTMSDYPNEPAPYALYKDNITSVIIEGGVTSVGNKGFSEFSEITSVTILSSVESIGESAFSGCSNLENIIFDEESNLTIIGKSSFYGCSKLETIELPPKLKEISSHSFEGCNKLKSITILSNISYIQEYAFLNCFNLECIIYYGTNNPETIYDNSFSGCEQLSYIITYLTYSNETFGQFNVSKSSELPLTCPSKSNKLNSGEIAAIVICSFIFIVIICVVLFFTVFRKMKNKKPEEDTP